jgi:hypothetical protein
MTVTVIISRKAGAEAPKFAIPVSAIDYDEAGKPRAWIFDAKNNTVAPRSIVLGTIKILFSGMHRHWYNYQPNAD